MLQVERDGLLAAIERLEVERVALVRVGPYRARAVTADARILDLDDLGAEIGKELRAEGAGAELRDGHDAQAVERRWLCCSGCRVLGSVRGGPVSGAGGSPPCPGLPGFPFRPHAVPFTPLPPPPPR